MSTASSEFELGRYDHDPARIAIRARHRAPEDAAVADLVAEYGVPAAQRDAIERRAIAMIETMRATARDAGPVEALMREYDLSSDEGLVLMMLAEALLRIPDGATRDMLIRDKLGAADFDRHLGRSRSRFVNASSWALALTSRTLRGAEARRVWPMLAARVGEPMLRQAMLRAMALVGSHFVLGKTIEDALARSRDAERRGFRHSYDMLGEAALTEADATRYGRSYEAAIQAIGKAARGRGPIAGPGISIKLSALHPRYELRHRDRVLTELTPRILALAQMARGFDIGCTIDAEEADRLDLSLDIIGGLIRAPELAGWNGLGVAVQAYAKRVLPLIEWLAQQADAGGRRLMVRLVKGAYWDSEIKRAQEQGLDEYPVYTRKAATDLSYLVAARRILAAGDALFGQFATHNAATVAAIQAFADGRTDYEFQRLHGMGDGLYDQLIGPASAVSCRIYAPVGAHHDLLAYLVRRLLENGSSGSFVNQVGNAGVPAASLARDPAAILQLSPLKSPSAQRIALPASLYAPERINSRGFDFGDPAALDALAGELTDISTPITAGPVVDGAQGTGVSVRTIVNPADRRQKVGSVHESGAADIEAALNAASVAWPDWDRASVDERAACLDRAADRIEADRPGLITLAIREAGKTLAAAAAEVRETADLLRFYAASARISLATVSLPGPTGETNELSYASRGVFVCISPWNFPLAIFTGQVAAALVAGNCVIAKPAEQTPLIASRAISHLHAAGIPTGALAFLPGDGVAVGGALAADPRIAGVVFTGSTATARTINRTLAGREGPIATLIAETGGLNAMIVDSSALLEQAVADIVVSAFDSAGQRCSALRCVYVQDDIADDFAVMLDGAIAELTVGDPARISTDIGPLIDSDALAGLEAHAARMARPFALARLTNGADGYFFAPRAVWIAGIEDLEGEVFGPFLHVARYRSDELDAVLAAINRTGYGLTLGVQTRIDDTVERVRRSARVGNIYVNRTVIGAAVGSQPFGGEALSGTGPKAGGPNYVRRFATERTLTVNTTAAGGNPALLTRAGDPDP